MNKNISKKVSFISIIQIGIIILILPVFANAARTTSDISYQLEVPFGSNYTLITNLTEYLYIIYTLLVSSAGLLAFAGLIIGGVIRATSAGNDSRVTLSNEIMIGSVIGLIIALTSFGILSFINPDLVELKKVQIETIPLPSMNSTCGNACVYDYDCYGCNNGDAVCRYRRCWAIVTKGCGKKCTTKADCTDCADGVHVDCQYTFCSHVGESPYGGPCRPGHDEDCVNNPKERCRGTTGAPNHVCHDGSDGSVCNEDEEGKQGYCQTGLICQKTSYNVYKCMSVNRSGLAAGAPCTSNSECASTICYGTSGFRKCQDGMEADTCSGNSDCNPDYYCNHNDHPNPTYKCVKKKASGEECSTETGWSWGYNDECKSDDCDADSDWSPICPCHCK